ncbi:MAG: DUF2878 domain-containing protein [Pseudomonadota bacterium]
MSFPATGTAPPPTVTAQPGVPTTIQVLSNAVAFKAVWVSAIVGGANLNPWLGVWAGAAALALHLWQAPAKGSALRLVLLAALIGFSSDSLFAATGLLQYSSGQPVAWLGPVWILALWVAFGTTLNVAFRWLQGRWALAVLLGAICGPLSYLTGSQMGAVSFANQTLALACVSAAWAALLPALLVLAARFSTVPVAARTEVHHA